MTLEAKTQETKVMKDVERAACIKQGIDPDQLERVVWLMNLARSQAIDDCIKALDAVAPQVRAAIFAHVDATHIDTCLVDGINAEGNYSANVETRQRAYQDGIRVGRMSAAKAADAELAKLPSRLESLKVQKP